MVRTSSSGACIHWLLFLPCSICTLPSSVTESGRAGADFLRGLWDGSLKHRCVLGNVMIESLLSVLAQEENTGQYCKAPSHLLLVRLLPYILFSYSTLLGEKKPQPPKKQQKQTSNTSKPSRNSKQKSWHKPLSSHILSVLRVHTSVEKSA